MNRHESMLVCYTANKQIILDDFANKFNLMTLAQYTAHKARKYM